MIRVILNGNLKYSDKGGRYDGEDYPTGVEGFSIKYTADPIMRVSSGSFEINPYQEGNASGDRIIDIQDERELDCTIYYNDQLAFSGKAVRNKRGKMFSYQLKTIAKTTDLLAEDEYGPVPKVFGAVKHIAPQLIDTANQVYRVGGKVVKAYDNGQSIATAIYKAGVDVFGKTYGYEVFVPQFKILGTITVDAVQGEYDASLTINPTDEAEYTVSFDDLPGEEGVDKPFKEADVTGDVMDAGLQVFGTDGGMYAGKLSYSSTTTGWFIGRDGGTARVNIGGSTKYLKWDGANIIIKGDNFEMDAAGNATFAGTLNAASGVFVGIQVTANGTNSTATRLTVVGGTAPSSGLTSTTRLDFTPASDGQNHFYVWNTTTNAGWEEIVNIGVATIGSDSAFNYTKTKDNFWGHYVNHNSTKNAFYVFSGDYSAGAGIYSKMINSTSPAVVGENQAGGAGVHGIGTAKDDNPLNTDSIGGYFRGGLASIMLSPTSLPDTTGWGSAEAGRIVVDKDDSNKAKMWDGTAFKAFW